MKLIMQIPHYAVLSGGFGTAASVFGKFMSYSDYFIDKLLIESDQNVRNIFLFFMNQSIV